MIGRLPAALAVACAGVLWNACNSCPFELAERIGYSDPVQTLAPGASSRFDVTVQDVDDLEVDIANTAFPGATGRVDVWLTQVSCEALFEGEYPGSTPRCETLIGPVAPGAVSERKKVRPGRYRAFAQAYSANPAATRFDYDIGVWGRPCHSGYVGP